MEHRSGIQDIPLFCTPAENGNKACFDKVQSLLMSPIVQTLYRGSDMVSILASLKDAILPEPVELSDKDEKSKLKTKRWNLYVEE